MEKHQQIRGGADEAGEDGAGDTAGRRLSFWSHDVMIATALTVMAVSLLAVAWVSGGTRHNQQAGPATAITTK